MSDDIPHGRSGYTRYKCRCPVCRSEHAAYQRRYRERKAKEAGREFKPRPENARHGTRGKYVSGCHCQPCRDANNEYQKLYKSGHTLTDPWIEDALK